MKNRRKKSYFQYVITIFFVLTLNFFIPRWMPGDPFTFLSSDEGQLLVSFTEEQMNLYKEYYGLDKPLVIQYGEYIKNTFIGNLGYSIYYNDWVLHLILKRMKWTIGIVVISLLLSVFIGVILGCLSAWKRDTFFDEGLYGVMLILTEIPSFLIGIIFLFLFAAHLKWFPLSGGMKTYGNWTSEKEKIIDVFWHGMLPVITLAMTKVGEFYLISRNSMLSVLSKDYIQTAKAKGLKKRRILFKHGLKNAMLPVVTKIFLTLGSVFGGAVLIENVFQYPGIGKLMKEAIFVRDYPLIQGIFLFITITVLVMNLLADRLYSKLDPRVK